MLGSYPRARVLDFDPDFARVAAGAQGDGSALLDGIRCVHQKVHEHLIDLRCDALDFRKPGVLLDDLRLVLDFVPDDVERALETLF